MVNFGLSVLAVAAAMGIGLAPRAHAQVVDTHVHLWEGEKSLASYERQAPPEVKELGVMWFGGPNQALAGAPDDIRKRNDQLLQLVAKHKDLRPIATVHPYDGDAALAELARVAGLGVRVLKIHPHTQRFDPSDPRVLALAKRAGELNVAVLMDNANILPGDSEKLFNLALAAPRTTFIFAHLGGLNFRFWNILKAARTAEGLFGNNIYFDISFIVTLAADSPIQDEFIWTMRNVGIDHVLLGSDFPQYTPKQTLDAFNRLPLTDSERRMVSSENARKIFDR